jgi:hypothetical protein
MTRWIALPLICIAVAGAAATAATARTDARTVIVATTGPTAPLAIGLEDPIFFNAKQAPIADKMARQAGATYVRLIVSWASIAPVLPAGGFDRTDPKSRYYHWGTLDASVSAAVAAHVTPILDIVAAPRWAQKVLKSTWTGGQPKLAELGKFATAIATRYDGSGPEPAVHAFSVWNEPNYTKNLYPQDATFYRSMVNAVADSVHAVNPSNLVLAGELAPVKNLAQSRNHPIPPLTWMRTMLCLSTTTPVHRTCSTKADFDVWAHHPYSDTGPYGHSKAPGGVELGDLPKMYKLLQTAERLGAISSAKPVQFWVTEEGWSSKPPNTKGAPMLLEARWLAESMYQMWKSGVTLGIWFLLRDETPNTPWQSGLYYFTPTVATARVKPLYTPFHFPFVAYLKSNGKVFFWGRDTTGDVRTVAIQEQTQKNGPWTTVANITSNNHGIFQAMLPLKAQSTYSLRASATGSGISRPFALKVPDNENLVVVPFPPN